MDSAGRQSRLDPTVVEAYARDGAVRICGLFTTEQIADLTKGIEENLRDPSPLAQVASHPDDPGWFFEDFCNWQVNGAYRRLIFESSVGGVVAQLMQSHEARLYHDHLLVKEPGTRQRTPWHQESALLQRRRPSERQHVATGRSGPPRDEPGIRGGFSPRTVANAADFPEHRSQMVPGGQLGGAAGH